MAQHRILFNGREIATMATDADLASFLHDPDTLGFLPPRPILEFVHANGNKLYMGIAPEGNYLEYVDASLDPPYFSSVGIPAEGEDDEIVEFQMSEEGHVTEISRADMVAFEDLVRVATAFLRSGTRPADAIAWKQE